MAIKELYTSREQHITKDGQTVSRYFICTKAEWNARTDGLVTIPNIGDIWGINRPDLIVSDIVQTWLDSDKCKIEVLYSTKGTEFREKKANKIGSIIPKWDFRCEAKYVDSYYDTSSKTYKLWSDVWTSAGQDANQLPKLIQYDYNLVFVITVYIRTWELSKIQVNVGKINDSDFVKQWVRKGFDPIYNTHGDIENYGWWKTVDSTGDDTGKWLFAGFKSDKISTNNYEVTYTFYYNKDGWNKYKKDTGVLIDVFLYDSFNFYTDLFWPDDSDVTSDDNLRENNLEI